MRLTALFVAAAALSLTPAAASAKPVGRASVARDWTQTVVVTPEGGFRMGNPAAPVKLIEYGSLACPHCRHFEETGFRPLTQGYVRSGRVSYEFRNLLINAPDISISLLTRCAGPSKFFPMSAYVYSVQPQWEKKIEALTSAQQAELEKLTDQQRIIRLAQVGGMLPIAARFGLSPARAMQCLSDAKAMGRLVAMTQAGNDLGVMHTPTFLINGKIVEAATWEDLEPLLKTALGT
jgi:protein-disulfide isomerase